MSKNLESEMSKMTKFNEIFCDSNTNRYYPLRVQIKNEDIDYPQTTDNKRHL